MLLHCVWFFHLVSVLFCTFWELCWPSASMRMAVPNGCSKWQCRVHFVFNLDSLSCERITHEGSAECLEGQILGFQVNYVLRRKEKWGWVWRGLLRSDPNKVCNEVCFAQRFFFHLFGIRRVCKITKQAMKKTAEKTTNTATRKLAVSTSKKVIQEKDEKQSPEDCTHVLMPSTHDLRHCKDIHIKASSSKQSQQRGQASSQGLSNKKRIQQSSLRIGQLQTKQLLSTAPEQKT